MRRTALAPETCEGCDSSSVEWAVLPGYPLGEYAVTAVQGALRATGRIHVWPAERSSERRLEVVAAEGVKDGSGRMTVQARSTVVIAIAGFQAHRPVDVLFHYTAQGPQHLYPDNLRFHTYVTIRTDALRDDQDKEVLYLFLGNAAERQGVQQRRQQHLQAAQRSFRDALRNYRRALRIDPEYARARYGIAETRFLQLHLDCRPDRTDRDRLEQVADAFKQAQRASHRPTLASIDARSPSASGGPTSA